MFRISDIHDGPQATQLWVAAAGHVIVIPWGMNFSRLFTTWDSVVLVGLATVTMYVAVVVCTRVAGPRSLDIPRS